MGLNYRRFYYYYFFFSTKCQTTNAHSTKPTNVNARFTRSPRGYTTKSAIECGYPIDAATPSSAATAVSQTTPTIPWFSSAATAAATGRWLVICQWRWRFACVSSFFVVVEVFFFLMFNVGVGWLKASVAQLLISVAFYFWQRKNSNKISFEFNVLFIILNLKRT